MKAKLQNLYDKIDELIFAAAKLDDMLLQKLDMIRELQAEDKNEVPDLFLDEIDLLEDIGLLNIAADEVVAGFEAINREFNQEHN